MPRAVAIHIREKATRKDQLFCGGGRCNDPSSLKSVAVKDSKKATCGKCLRNLAGK